MSTNDYQSELTALKDSVHQLIQTDINLSLAMTTYKQGIEQQQHCLSMLKTLEQNIQELHTSDININREAIELRLEDVFRSLEDIESTMNELPDARLESCIELLEQAERLLHVGYVHIHQASDMLASSETTIAGADRV